MNAEKDIVNIWLNQHGFFTVRDINAKNRVIDFLAYKPGEVIQHIEVNCSVSSSNITQHERSELARQFDDSNVTSILQHKISQMTNDDAYENILITTAKTELADIRVIPFQDVLADVITNIDKQKYTDPVMRALQLVKYSLIGSPSEMASIFNSMDKYKPLTSAAKEQMLKSLLNQDTAQRLFRKKENEDLLLELVRSSTLRNPERLAAALTQVLTKRSATRFMNVLLQKEEIKQAAAEEIVKDKKLEEFFAIQ